MDQNLCIALDALVKLLVCLRRFVNTDLMGDDKGRVSAAGDDHIAEVPVIFLDIALTRSESEALSSILGQPKNRV